MTKEQVLSLLALICFILAGVGAGLPPVVMLAIGGALLCLANLI